jgi:hypothetical protein
MKITTNQKTSTASIKSTKVFHAVYDSDTELESSWTAQAQFWFSTSEYKTARDGPKVDFRILGDEISFVRASVMQEVKEWPM